MANISRSRVSPTTVGMGAARAQHGSSVKTHLEVVATKTIGWLMQQNLRLTAIVSTRREMDPIAGLREDLVKLQVTIPP